MDGEGQGQGAEHTTDGSGDGDGGADPRDAQIAELRREAGSYRTQRNAALRRSHAFETIVNAHQIDASSVTEAALAALPISEGKVDGQFQYTPPKPTATPASRQAVRVGETGQESALTREAIAEMRPDQVNARWNEIKEFLRAGG